MLLYFGLTLVAVLVLRSGLSALILHRLRAPRLPHLRTPLDLGWVADSLRIPTAGGKTLFAWFVPVKSAGPSAAVVVMHGWGANASMMLPVLAPLNAAGFAVLLIDARCHGASDDESFMSLPRFAQDIEAGLDWLKQHPGIDAARLTVIGHSVGAGAALLTATRRDDVQAVVSLSAFAHPKEIMRSLMDEAGIPYPLLGWYVMQHVQAVIGARFDDIAPINSMTKLRCPVLLVHGADDQVVPFQNVERLHSAGRPGLVQCLRVSGGHDPSESIKAHLTSLTDFLRQPFSAQPGR
jgi:dipeptidyl aminopeptidase/acylaminoacyl peptidase